MKTLKEITIVMFLFFLTVLVLIKGNIITFQEKRDKLWDRHERFLSWKQCIEESDKSPQSCAQCNYLYNPEKDLFIK